MTTSDADRSTQRARRPYTPPTLRVYGAMRALTAAGTGMLNEPRKGAGSKDPTRKR